jgi:hypothetical protein
MHVLLHLHQPSCVCVLRCPAVNHKKTTSPKLKDFRDYLDANSVPEIEALLHNSLLC